MGKTIQLRGQPYEVIGVLAEKGEAAFLRPDEQIFIPISTAQYRLFGGRERLSSIYAATTSSADLDQAYGEIDRVLRRAHRIQPGANADFNIRNAADLLNTFNETNRTFTIAVGRDRRGEPTGGRDRHHEHHAGQRDRAHPRDRRA